MEVSYSTVSLDDAQSLSVAYHVCMTMTRILFVREMGYMCFEYTTSGHVFHVGNDGHDGKGAMCTDCMYVQYKMMNV